MTTWRVHPKDLKRYPHFDKPLSIKEIEELVTDPKRVAANSFFPLLQYTKKWQPFRDDGGKPDPKTRPIRYAARRDSYIYSYYRHLISVGYEAELSRLGISHCPIAYRRIPVGDGSRGGKCNIHFAKDVFDQIRKLGDCCVIALDISSFFESLDHEILKATWCKMIQQDRLPADHFAVFKSVTQYSYVDRQKVYERLGYFGTKRFTSKGMPIDGYLVKYDKIPTQLCPTDIFRSAILGQGSGAPSLLVKNKNAWGIPQGTPISDILANIYMIYFDKKINEMAVDAKGFYYRYSDDIIIIAPLSASDAIDFKDKVIAEIEQHGSELRIKDSKSAIVEYKRQSGGQSFHPIMGDQGRNGVEYLGFRYDGKKAFLRDSTLSGLHRKIAAMAKREAYAAVRRYPNKDEQQLLAAFKFEDFMKRFGRVENFENVTDPRRWTFWTYVTKAREIFGSEYEAIGRQMKSLRAIARNKVQQELAKALAKRK